MSIHLYKFGEGLAYHLVVENWPSDNKGNPHRINLGNFFNNNLRCTSGYLILVFYGAIIDEYINNYSPVIVKKKEILEFFLTFAIPEKNTGSYTDLDSSLKTYIETQIFLELSK